MVYPQADDTWTRKKGDWAECWSQYKQAIDDPNFDKQSGIQNYAFKQLIKKIGEPIKGTTPARAQRKTKDVENLTFKDKKLNLAILLI